MKVAELPVAEREAALAQACAGSASLRGEVEALLRAHQQAEGFMASPSANMRAIPWDATPLCEGPGTRIGHYKLLQQIGEGGFGVVFMAEQERPVVRRVALKILKLGMDTKQVIGRFEAERQALAMMDHPNIARVLDAGATETGRPYFVMELVKGVPITEYCDTANLSTAERLALFIPVCHAVQHAHQKGIIHRDIKPSNVLVTLHDGNPVPKVIDFGIAKATQGRLTDKTVFTEYRQMIGTPEYMSPEQAEMTGLDIDTRTDVYSLGVLLYELMTGVTPFAGHKLRSAAYEEILRILREVEPPKPSTRISTLGDALASTAAHRQTEPRRLSGVLKGDLDWIAMKALEKDRTRRYDTANDLAADVQRHLNREPVVAAPPSAAYRTRKFITKHRAPIAVVGVVGAALLIGLVATGMMLVRAVSAEGKLRQQNSTITEERNRAVGAEQVASTERQRAESESARAQRLYAEGLISNGDALVNAGEYRGAYAKFAEALAELERRGESLERLDLSLVRLRALSPPPLWSIQLDPEVSYKYGLIPSRNELVLLGDDVGIHVVDVITGDPVRLVGNFPKSTGLIVNDRSPAPELVVGFTDRTDIVDPISGDVLRTMPDGRAMRGGVVTPDGRGVASVDLPRHVILWNPETLDIARTIDDAGTVRFIALSPDGSRLAGANFDGQVLVWDMHDGSRIATMTLPAEAQGRYSSIPGGIYSLAFSVDGQSLVLGLSDGRIVSLGLNGNAAVLGKPHEQMVMSLCTPPDGERIITGAADGEICVSERALDGWVRTCRVVDGQPGRMQLLFVAGTGAKACEAMRGMSAQDQGVIIGISGHGAVSAWPVVAPCTRAHHLDNGMSTSPDGLFTAGFVDGAPRGQTTEVRDTLTGRIVRTVSGAGGGATAFGPDAGTFYVGSIEGAVWRTELTSARSVWGVQSHKNSRIWELAPSPDGRLLGTAANDDGTTRVWDTADGELVRALPGQGTTTWALAFLPQADTRTASALRPAGMSSPAEVSSDRLVVGSGDAAFISDWDLSGATTVRRAPAHGVRGLTLSPDRHTLVVVGGSDTIDLLDVDTFKSVGTMGPSTAMNYDFEFVAPDRSRVRWGVSTGRTDLRVWDVQERKEALVLLRNVVGQYAGTMTVAPDGSAIVVSGIGRIDFSMPRRDRELRTTPGNIARAEIYARYGLWQWVRTLVEREGRAGHAVPALLRARAAWMCGDYVAAKSGFAEAARVGEVSKAYAQLCAAVEDEPVDIALPPPAQSPADPGSTSSPARALEPGVLDAADVTTLRGMIEDEVVVEGVIVYSAWSRTGKAMNINFAGTSGSDDGMVAVLFLADRERFDQAFGGDVASTLSGARVRMRGTLVMYGGYDSKWANWPQIVLNDPMQVTIQK